MSTALGWRQDLEEGGDDAEHKSTHKSCIPGYHVSTSMPSG